jgi:O-methyltransferase
MSLIDQLRDLVKGPVLRFAPTLILPKPFYALEPERLYYYLDSLWQRREIEGCVLEVGCWLGGTAATAYRFLEQSGAKSRRYVCIDTFGGFVEDQFQADLANGTPANERKSFQVNSKALVRKLLNSWDAAPVELVQGDIVTLPEAQIPSNIAVCLLDVDLELPIYEGLKRIAPKVVSGGIILVDDCPPNDNFAGARIGYAKYCAEVGIPEEYVFGLGIIRVP